MIMKLDQRMIDLLGHVVDHATFDVPPQWTLNGAQLSQAYMNARPNQKFFLAAAKPQVDHTKMSELTEGLRQLLGPYLEDDCLGFGLIGLIGGWSRFTIDRFAHAVVTAAAVLGPQRVMRTITEWMQGELLSYWTHLVLSGVAIDQSLELKNGISLTRLPESIGGLSDQLPLESNLYHGMAEFVGAVLVTIPCTAAPALYNPRSNPGSLTYTWADGLIPPFSLDTFCEALSLSVNHYVSWTLSWIDCEELLLFNPGTNAGARYRYEESLSPTRLTQEMLEMAHALLKRRDSRMGEQRRVDLAIRRWMNSKKRSTLADQFIELRIGLEALFLDDSRDEKRFRLATNGAWRLGTNYDQRSEYHRTLRDAYDRGSEAVHAGEVAGSAQNRESLEKAQNLCREGILTRLNESENPDWNQLILGKGPQGHQP